MSLLLDRLLATCDLEELNNRTLVVVSRLDDCDNLDSSSLIVKQIFDDLYPSFKPFVTKYTKRKELIHKHDAEIDSFDATRTVSVSALNHVSLALRQLNQMHNASCAISELHPLAKELEDLVLIYSLVTILLSLGQLLIDVTLPLSDDIEYFDTVLNSRLNLTVYTLQTFPSNLVNLAVQLFRLVSEEHHGMISIPQGLPKSLEYLYIQWSRWIVPLPSVIVNNMTSFIHSPSTYMIRKQRSSHLLAKSVIASSIGLPFIFSVSQLTRKRKALLDLKERNVWRLGFLVDELISTFGLDNQLIDLDYSVISKLNDFLGDDKDSLSIKPSSGAAVSLLYDIVSKKYPLFRRNLKITSSQRPSWITRYWIVALLGSMYIPNLVTSVFTNRQAIVSWIKINLIDTVIGFWKNWILQPLQNVLKTIRHDDDSRIAVMSKQSLNSDLDSLEQMVVDYCIDNYPSFHDASLSSDEKGALIDQIKYQVKSGDMHMVMKIYEDNVKAPVKSLVSGSMLRNLLIQIQKTKVDGAVALAGIDKIIQSQELVFGLVAASPACLFVCLVKSMAALERIDKHEKEWKVCITYLPKERLDPRLE
ncbi:hypothetical protein FOA43_002050 [Brettanomyces nanus]|uniref:Uncharacterized protein n=1 Tax=Eeniella nana TaxID=13502 RepID=A0A875RUM0_EENNA|nr:uncharacterized protein FOA43_002050 [Brettanomyces nanus]QPG74717.1 hypothetical protein FOA43_002050 [Brettanomyces nanus]